jgi:hypothetical protein
MDKFKVGEHIIVRHYDTDVIAIAGEYDEERELQWVDLKLMDSSPGHIVMTGFELKDCRKLTEAEAFKHKLQDKRLGLYGNH